MREATRVRAEVPLLLEVAGTVLRGSIDLLVERDGGAAAGRRLQDRPPRRRRARPSAPRRYEIQRAIYALAVAEALGAPEVEVAYVFLERPEEPVARRSAGRDGAAAAAGGRDRQIGRGEFPVASPRARWDLCRGCPALRGLCSGPERQPTSEAASSFAASSSSRSSFSPSPTASSSAAQ